MVRPSALDVLVEQPNQPRLLLDHPQQRAQGLERDVRVSAPRSSSSSDVPWMNTAGSDVMSANVALASRSARAISSS